MPKKLPWHAESEPYHHNNTECVVGASIQSEKRLPGDGDKPLCRICAALNRSESKARN